MAEKTDKTSTKVLVIIFIGVAFLAGYLVSRARYKPQINDLSTMVIERDEKISFLNNLRNRLVFRDGELIQVKDGDRILVEDTVILSEAGGIKVNPDGSVVRPDGEEEQLNDGDSIFIDGTIVTQEEVAAMQDEDNLF